MSFSDDFARYIFCLSKMAKTEHLNSENHFLFADADLFCLLFFYDRLQFGML